MSAKEIRIEVAGLTFRLFADRSQAIGVANLLTRQADAQFNAIPVKGSGGHLVYSAAKAEIHDASGLLPAQAHLVLKKHGSYFDWAN
jgi:hypothetical protein